MSDQDELESLRAENARLQAELVRLERQQIAQNHTAFAGQTSVGANIAGGVQGGVVAPLFPQGSSGNYIAGVLNIYQQLPSTPPVGYVESPRRYLECLWKGYEAMSIQWPASISLRLWQSEFIGKYHAEDKENFLLVATPGAGKTIVSMRVAYDLLRSAIVKRVVVVCPTDNLRNQWLEEAYKVGVPLDKLNINPWNKQIAQTEDVFGFVTTYAQVSNKVDVIKAYVERSDTLVIFDEIHHCGDSDCLLWGRSIQSAFGKANRRLLLSGTPFRSDNAQIPFVKYVSLPGREELLQCIADYTYGYGDALKDEDVVRHIVFPSWDGHLIWENFGETKHATFKDVLNQSESRYRLQTALDPRGEWIKQVILAADEKLNYIRSEEGHKDAGGLIVTSDQDSAKALAALLKELTGEECTLAISEFDDASADISRFKNSTQKWIVAIKMVSEGVDIKRLRVGVYATYTMTRTFFRQVIGRVIRWDSRWNNLDDQTAWFYLPEDPGLIELAKEIKVEITDIVRQQEEEDKVKGEKSEADGTRKIPLQTQMELSAYEFKHSEGEESSHIFNGSSFSKNELQEAEKILDFPGFERVPAAAKANALRSLRSNDLMSSLSESTGFASTTQPPHQRKQDLKAVVKRKVSRLVHICQQNGIYLQGNSYQIINNAWGRRRGYSHESSADDLQAKLQWIEGLIERALQGDKNISKELQS